MNPFLFLIVEIYALITGFLCYAALKPIWRQLDLTWQIIFSPFAVFYLADVSCRCTIGWVLFWEMPEWTLMGCTITHMCNSHVLDKDGASPWNYKRRISRGVCKTLNIIQNGHCECLTTEN
jgi:hypothetical protein